MQPGQARENRQPLPSVKKRGNAHSTQVAIGVKFARDWLEKVS